ncbi:phosphatase PAP2 family protein [Flavobacterium procerum]|uniref:phosphatase PAP2 family protein n=1 Tax=Flavobacterium procerum TaxID=1455569 RepID=UPI0035EBDCC4
MFKHTFQRLRPCNNPDLKSIIRIVQIRNSYSFFSGHAANTMAVASFLSDSKNEVWYFGFIF